MLGTIVIFLIILLVLVLVHEFGHFIFAKWSNVKVDEFAFGFPPRLASFQKGETRYSFNLVPLGGYVKIEGEEGDNAGDPRSFAAQRFYKKILIIAAGVGFNFILAYFLFSLMFMVGNEDPKSLVQITEVQKNSPAEAAGLMPGDRILFLKSEADFLESNVVGEIQKFINDHRGKVMEMKVNRFGDEKTVHVTPRTQTNPGEGAVGIAMVRAGIPKLGFFASLKEGFLATVAITAETAKALANFFKELFAGESSFEQVSGPVGIVRAVGDYSSMGFLFLVQLTALLSINLGLINLIPFPGLDGGRIFILILEKIKGSPFNWKFTQAYHAIGFVILILLMIVITYHDIIKLTS